MSPSDARQRKRACTGMLAVLAMLACGTAASAATAPATAAPAAPATAVPAPAAEPLPPPPDGTIAYVLTDLHWGVFESADGKTECPHGYNEGNREHFKTLFPQDGRQRRPALPGPSQQVITQVRFPGQTLSGPQWISHVSATAQKRVLLLSAIRVQMHASELLQWTCCSSCGQTERSRHCPSQPVRPLAQCSQRPRRQMSSLVQSPSLTQCSHFRRLQTNPGGQGCRLLHLRTFFAPASGVRPKNIPIALAAPAATTTRLRAPAPC